MGRPVRVERTRRCVRDLCVVKRRNSGAGVVMVGGCVYGGFAEEGEVCREINFGILPGGLGGRILD